MECPLNDAQIERYVRIRRTLHTVPELGFEEHKTAQIIRDALDEIRVETLGTIDAAPTATVALIGDARKPCVALRADIDALPIVEQTGVAYASTHEGKMHACGHDGHTATLLATAAALKQAEAELDVCVKLIFQPAEEGGGGGDRLTRAGVLDGRIGPRVEAIFGLHGWPGLPVGMVSTRPGPLLAATDTWQATFVGKGCHGAFPHWGRDPIVPAAEAVVNLQQVVSREVDPTEPMVVTVGMFHAGTATNVIPDRATISGTARTLTPEARVLVQKALERRCRGIAEAGGCEVEFQFTRGYPPTINHPQMADFVERTARHLLGADRYIPAARPSMGGEDFAYYLEKTPGCFFLIGLIPEGRSEYPSLHSDRFDFTDTALPTGVGMFTQLVRTYGR
jgi:amidohydrolase